MFTINCWLHGTNPPMRSGDSPNLFAYLLTAFGAMRSEARGRNDVLSGVMTFTAVLETGQGKRHYHGTMRVTASDSYEMQLPTIEWHSNGTPS